MFFQGKNNKKLYMGYFPQRKKPILAIFKEPNIICKMATFNDGYSMLEFMEFLGEFTDIDGLKEALQELRGKSNEN